MKKDLALVMFLFTINVVSFSQSGFVAGNYYSVAGNSQVVCGQPYYGWNNQLFQDCQRQIWITEYYAGYIYVWGGFGWVTEYRSGYYWRFYWSSYTNRL